MAKVRHHRLARHFLILCLVAGTMSATEQTTFAPSKMGTCFTCGVLPGIHAQRPARQRCQMMQKQELRWFAWANRPGAVGSLVMRFPVCLDAAGTGSPAPGRDKSHSGHPTYSIPTWLYQEHPTLLWVMPEPRRPCRIRIRPAILR